MNNDKLSLSPDVREVRRGDRYIYLNPNIPRWIVTDKFGKLILSLFNGEYTCEEIVSTVVEGLGDPAQRDKIQAFCDHVISSGLLDEVKPRPRGHRLRLSSVHLSLADHCNLNCTYCYARERVEKKHKPLTLEEYKSVIDDLLEIDPKIIFSLTGGEPLLNKDCLRIAEYIKSKGAETILMSNGLLISEANIQDIAANIDIVSLSIDGPNDAVHSLTRGHSFDKVIRATQLLEKNGVDYRLSMTVTKDNIGYVGETAKMFGNRLNYAPYFPISGDVSSLAITGLEYYNALNNAGVKALSTCQDSLEDALSSPCHKCSLGDGVVSISATGDVYPCQLLHTDEFYGGNVHEQNVKDIYRNAEAINRCANLDVDTNAVCKDCPLKYICGGSCRARAYYGCGDINSATEFCQYEQEAFYDGIVAMYSRNALK